jgi:hypothetical protein
MPQFFLFFVDLAFIVLFMKRMLLAVHAEMAAFSKRPDRFLGVHFFNPVQVRNPSSLTVEKIICV